MAALYDTIGVGYTARRREVRARRDGQLAERTQLDLGYRILVEERSGMGVFGSA